MSDQALILTHSLAELGLPRLSPVGPYCDVVRVDDKPGASINAVEAAVRSLTERHGATAVVLRARFDFDYTHSGYGHSQLVLRVTGDLCTRDFPGDRALEPRSAIVPGPRAPRPRDEL